MLDANTYLSRKANIVATFVEVSMRLDIMLCFKANELLYLYVRTL